MKTRLTLVWLGMAVLGTSSMAQAAPLYGWDILCKGDQKLVVHAHQSDDDFYIETRGGDLGKRQIWADWTKAGDTGLKTLDFDSSKEVSSTDPETHLRVIRQSTPGFGYAHGVLRIDLGHGLERYDLSCFVRYGEGEDDFDEVIKKPFPPIGR